MEHQSDILESLPSQLVEFRPIELDILTTDECYQLLKGAFGKDVEEELIRQKFKVNQESVSRTVGSLNIIKLKKLRQTVRNNAALYCRRKTSKPSKESQRTIPKIKQEGEMQRKVKAINGNFQSARHIVFS